MAVNLQQMSILLGIKIIEIGRTFIKDSTDCYPLMHTLFFKTSSTNMIQLLQANQDGLYIQTCSSKDQPIIDPEFEIDPEDRLVFRKIEIEHSSFPFEIDSITEFWAGSKGKEFLVGFTLHGKNQEILLSICTETDEIELMKYDTLRERIESFPFYYGTVLTHWYRKN